LGPDRWFTLIAVVDDATKQLLDAARHDGGESVAVILTALRHVLERHGVPIALYTDRAHWAVHTPTSGRAPDRRRPTQVGRALARLGIEHILGYSPQARGRRERVNRTLQDRLVNELRVAGITTVAAAHRYLRERFLPAVNEEFRRPPADPASALVALGRVDLDQILCVEDERVVGRDNVVTTERQPLQLAKQPGLVPVLGCAYSCAAISVVTIRSGMAAGASAAMTRPAGPCGRPELMPFTERPTHGVKQLRPTHESTTEQRRVVVTVTVTNGAPDRRGW